MSLLSFSVCYQVDGVFIAHLQTEVVIVANILPPLRHGQSETMPSSRRLSRFGEVALKVSCAL